MAEELKLKTDKTPSLFNKDMVLGGLLAAFIPGGLVVSAAAIATGAVIGGWMGKKRIEKENTVGKDVGKPSFWNKDTLIGGLMGNQIGAWLGGVAMVAIIGAGLAASGMDVSAATTLMRDAAADVPGAANSARALIASTPNLMGYMLGGVAALAASALGGTALGAYIGGKSGKSRMEKEVDEAKHQQVVAELTKNVSPEVGQAVAYAMEHNKELGNDHFQKKLLEAGQTQPHHGRTT